MFAAEYWPGCRITLNTENKNTIINVFFIRYYGNTLQ